MRFLYDEQQGGSEGTFLLDYLTREKIIHVYLSFPLEFGIIYSKFPLDSFNCLIYSFSLFQLKRDKNLYFVLNTGEILHRGLIVPRIPGNLSARFI